MGSNAEYGQVGDVTTVSKSGTNQYHGSGFWYAQNAALNALNFGETTKPKLIANDFGATIGGPVLIPHFYNGKDKTFFYGTYEGFRYPQAWLPSSVRMRCRPGNSHCCRYKSVADRLKRHQRKS